ncbi:MAG: enoyl-CoA hydratase/isomerase family protein [Sandaracinaceae bacterium]|nr:enoyl-CoA hydratase/isomerase family protein [Sandaracinaceae bacterium]
MGEQAKREIEAAGGLGVRTERRGAIAIWTIDRPERLNALSRAAVRELGRLAREAAGDRTLRAVVLTGAGDKAFCAGADLKERRSMDEEDVRDFLPLYRASFGAIDRLGVPVIAALDGVAFGGGLELALACDLRVAASHVTLGLTETSLGIIPGAGGTQRLTRIVGEARAKELVLFARRVDAAEALALGIVNRVAPEGTRALDFALAWAEPLTRAAPIAIAAALEAIDGAGDRALDDGLSLEARCYERTLASEDRLEALAAFAEKRAPSFKGR